MNFQPAPGLGRGYLFVGTLVGAIFTLIALNLLFQQETPPQMFVALSGVLVALSVTMLLGYLALIAANIRYHLNRNGLTIYWGVSRQRIPFNDIEQIVPASEHVDGVTFQGINLAGLRLGRGVLAGGRSLKFRGIAGAEQSLLILTAQQAYLISPRAPAQMIEAWQARQAIGPTQQWHEGTRPLWPFDTPLLSDQLAWSLIGGGVLLLIAMLGYISLNYPELPATLPVHFNGLGRADRIAPKVFLFTLPAVGAIVWLTNFLLGSVVYRRERMGAYLLWGSNAAVQLSLWVAMFTITGA